MNWSCLLFSLKRIHIIADLYRIYITLKTKMDWSKKLPQPGREKMSMAQPPTIEIVGLSSTTEQVYTG